MTIDELIEQVNYRDDKRRGLSLSGSASERL